MRIPRHMLCVLLYVSLSVVVSSLVCVDHTECVVNYKTSL